VFPQRERCSRPRQGGYARVLAQPGQRRTIKRFRRRQSAVCPLPPALSRANHPDGTVKSTPKDDLMREKAEMGTCPVSPTCIRNQADNFRVTRDPPAIGGMRKPGEGIPDQLDGVSARSVQARWSAGYRYCVLPFVTGGRHKSAQFPCQQLRKDNRRGVFPISSHDLQADGQATLATSDRGYRGRTSSQRSMRNPA